MQPFGGVPAHPAINEAEGNDHPVSPAVGQPGNPLFEPRTDGGSKHAASRLRKPVRAGDARALLRELPAAVCFAMPALRRHDIDEDGIVVRTQSRRRMQADGAHLSVGSRDGRTIVGDAITLCVEQGVRFLGTRGRRGQHRNSEQKPSPHDEYPQRRVGRRSNGSRPHHRVDYT